MKYQIYAMTKNNELNHAGTHEIENLTIEACRKLERAWRRWRRNYIKANPGNYPLARPHSKTYSYIIHPVGESAKSMRIPLNGSNV